MDDSTSLTDRTQVGRLWVQTQPIVGAFIASTVRNKDDVEDLIQDVAVAVTRDFDKFTPNTSFTAWALTIARNRILNYRRKQATNRVVFDTEVLDCLSAAASRLDPRVEIRIDALRVCMARLEGRSARVLQMRYMRNETPTRIAQHLGMTFNAVCSLLYRTRTALEVCIKHRLRKVEGRS